MSTSFEEIGQRAGTDKVTHHGYQRFYPRYIENIRETATGMLEIGISKHNSIHLWQKYFTKAHVYGIDIEYNHSVDPRVTMIQADQSKLEDLERTAVYYTHPIQFIIDDGSHIPEHQVLTFNYFFDKLLQPGGIYIVEDIELSYWTKGEMFSYPAHYGYKHPNSFIEKVKPIIDKINEEFLLPQNKGVNDKMLGGFSAKTLSQIATISFGQNCVIFTKKSAEDMVYSGRPYRFSCNL
jgi:hypothetical protein